MQVFFTSYPHRHGAMYCVSQLQAFPSYGHCLNLHCPRFSSNIIIPQLTIKKLISWGPFAKTGCRNSSPCTIRQFVNVIIIFLVLGFIPSVFIGIERGWTYSVQAGFLSGKPPQGGTLFLDLVLGTAGELIILSSCSRSYFFCYLLGMKDVSASPQVRPHATEPILTFQIELTLDGISQEFNETFSIYIIGVDLDNYFLFPVEAPVTVNCLEGTIIDQDSKSSLLLALLTMSNCCT